MGRICGSGEDSLGNILALYFLQKNKTPLNHCRISKCYSGQEIQIGPPESSDVRKQEIHKFVAVNNGVNSSRERRRFILQCLPPSATMGFKAWHTEKPGYYQWWHTQGFSQGPWYNFPSPYPTRQKHMCLYERTRYYGNRYSICGYIILWYIMSTL